jgi:hypothetical protein
MKDLDPLLVMNQTHACPICEEVHTPQSRSGEVARIRKELQTENIEWPTEEGEMTGEET